ncbi:MAG: hypothetical protein R6V10_14335 [bacterium]
MSSELYHRMKEFYDQSELPQKVTRSLKEGAVAEVEFEGDDKVYMMIKENGRSHFRPGKPDKPEIYMKFSQEAVEWLMEIGGDSEEDIQEYVRRFGECILKPTDTRWIRFKLCTNVVKGARMGYFGMMKAGGKQALDLALSLGIKVPKAFR